MARLLRFTLAALLPLAVACSDSGEDGCVRDGQSGFEARAPFDGRARVRRVDCGFHSSVEELAAGTEGSVWLRRIEYPDRGEDTFFFPPNKWLTHVGAGGEFLGELALPDFVEALVVHPSGELTAIGWEKAPAQTAIQLRRFRPDGSVVAERLLVNDTPPEERLNYQANAQGNIRRVEVLEEERGLGAFAAVAWGEDVYLLAGMDGLRVLRLDSALRTQWTGVVAPSVALVGMSSTEEMAALGAPFLKLGLAVDEAGRVHVARPFLGVDRRAYAEAFRRLPEGPEGRGVLLTTFAPTGELLSARTLLAERADELTGLVVGNGAFALAAREPVSGGESHDLFFAAGRLDGPPEDVVTRTFDLDNEDVPAALVPCQGDLYCIAGHTGFLGRVVGRNQTDGQGFLLAVDARGEQRDLLLLQGERDTEVLHAVPGPGGSVVFTFSTNQPPQMSTVPNHLKSNEVWLGTFGP